MFEYDTVNRWVFRRLRKVSSDGADVTTGGKLFQTWGPTTEKALSPMVDRLDCGWMRRLVLAERRARRLGRRVSCTINKPHLSPKFMPMVSVWCTNRCQISYVTGLAAGLNRGFCMMHEQMSDIICYRPGSWAKPWFLYDARTEVRYHMLQAWQLG